VASCSVGRRHRDADGGSNGGSWGRRRALHDIEHSKMSKKDRWAAIARMIEMVSYSSTSATYPVHGPVNAVLYSWLHARRMQAGQEVNASHWHIACLIWVSTQP